MNEQIKAQSNIIDQLSSIPNSMYSGLAAQRDMTTAEQIAMQNIYQQNQLSQMQAQQNATFAAQAAKLIPTPPQPKTIPEFGVNKEDYSPESLLVVFYIKHRNGDRFDSADVMTIEEAYFPLNVLPDRGSACTYLYPGQAFQTREDAQNALGRMFRKYFMDRLSDFLNSFTAIQLERGMTDDAECDLADAMRAYIKAVSP